jgi:RNA polymerase sigma factor (sigma-70 family)
MATPKERSRKDPEHSDGSAFQRLLAERMVRLPELQKKVLAMYYYENMPLSEIAAIFGVTESRICQIRREAVATCWRFFWLQPGGSNEPSTGKYHTLF